MTTIDTIDTSHEARCLRFIRKLAGRAAKGYGPSRPAVAQPPLAELVIPVHSAYIAFVWAQGTATRTLAKAA